MDDLQLTIVSGFHVDSPAFDMTTRDAWFFPLRQKYFGPNQLLVVTARPEGQVIGVAHCDLTEPPEMALKCCLATLDDGAATAVAYSDEPTGFDSTPGLEERFATARAAAREFGVHLVDWMLCDDSDILSMRFLLEQVDGVEAWWEVPSSHSGVRHGRGSNRRRGQSPRRRAS